MGDRKHINPYQKFEALHHCRLYGCEGYNKEYYEQIYTNKFEILDEVEKLLKNSW